MAPLHEPSNHSDQDMCKKNTVARFATLLGAFRLKKYPRNTKNNDGCLSTLFSTSNNSTCSVPSLSLNSYHHNEVTHHHQQQQQQHYHHSEDKHKVGEHAASNLARPLITQTRTSGNTDGTKSTQKVLDVTSEKEVPHIHQLPLLMLDNLAASFLTLVDARLRAYVTILARHGVSLSNCPALTDEEQQEGVAAVERKLNTLVEVGRGVAIDNMVAFFRIDPSDSLLETKEGVMIPIVMESTLDVSIPKVGTGSEIVTVAVSATGSIEACFDANGEMLTRVKVDVDTHKLLAQLIDRAALVMSAALDIVVTVSALPPQFPPAPLPKHKKTVAMPPPRPVAAQVSLAVVSPEISPKRKEPDSVSPLELDEMCLSPESCANIVDFVIGEVNHIIFPSLKRLKTA